MKCKTIPFIGLLIILAMSVSAWNNCNNTITTSGRYTLNQSLTCAGYSINLDNFIFRINTSNVEIDCEGYSLTINASDGIFDTWAVRGFTTTGRTNITIRNCNLVIIGQTQMFAIQNQYDNDFSLINNNITTNQNTQRIMDITRATGNPMPRNINISGNRFILTSTNANEPFLQLSNGINCSAGIRVYNNLFNVTSSGYVFSNRDVCEFAMSNATGMGNHFIDSRWNCTDNNSNGLCDNPYDIYRNYTGIYPTRDYYATAQYPYNCSPNWVCSGYVACNGSDYSACNAATDNNGCVGVSYSGDYSEFAGQACNLPLYSYDSTGFHVYEPFLSLNTSMWKALYNGWSITVADGNSQLNHLENDTSVSFAGFILNNPNFQVPIDSNFTLTQRMRYYDADDNYAFFGYVMLDNTDTMTQLGTDATYYAQIFAPYLAQEYFYEYNGSGSALYSASDSVSGTNGIVWVNLTFQKSLLSNGTVRFDYSVDGVPQWTHYSTYDYNSGMPDNIVWYSVPTYTSAADHQWSLDSVDLTVSYATNETCTPNWVCTGYGACNVSDLESCNSVGDTNLCGDSYTGNYSEFTPQSCNYCTASVSQYNQSACTSSLITTCYEDSNYASCCAVTALPSDCPQNASIVCSDAPCSESPFTYTGDDVAPAVLNGLTKAIITIGAFAVLIVLGVLLFSWQKILGKK